MSCTREFVRKIIKQSPNVIVGKRYDFYAKDCGSFYLIYQRDYEGKPWELIIRIDKDKVNSNKVGVWKHFERSYTSKYKPNPKHGNRYFTIE